MLRSEEPNVVVVAAAGCGKTYEAASLAIDLLNAASGCSVLLLAHTNGAVQEFARRTDGERARPCSTIDAFCLSSSPNALRLWRRRH